MESQIIELLKEVLPDAIKILGPALITGLVAYYSVKIQYKSKLEELSGSQSFKARERMLEYYTQKVSDAGRATNSLNYVLGYILGSSSETDSNGVVSKYTDTVKEHIDNCGFDITTTLREMLSVSLGDTEEYSKLLDYQEQSKELAASEEADIFKQNIRTLIKIYSFIARCNQLVLDSQIRILFATYIKAE